MKDHEQDILRQLPLSELHPFEDHPFSVLDDEQMQETVESIRSFGVLVPALVRPRENGGYEIVSGHRRKRACELAGLDSMPVIIREMSREEAVIAMVDSNLQRENILPSEKAKAYRMKLEAIKRQGERTDLTSCQVGTKFRADEQVAENSQDSARQVQRYIRLTELEPELQQMVDDGKMGMTPAVEISYLKPEEQKLLLETMDSEQATPSLSQAQRMKQMSRMGTLNDDTMLEIMMEQKKPESYNIVIPGDRVRKYFPKSYSTERIQETILKLLDAWARKREKQMEK
ncbi:MAG: ParB/RepB/Spo0J family partition protein [Anaerovoracaceae bacterium]